MILLEITGNYSKIANCKKVNKFVNGFYSNRIVQDLNFEKNDRVVIKEVMTTALKYHHYSIIKIIKRPLKSSKDVWNTKILNIFNAWKQTIVAKTTFVVIFQIYVVMTTSYLSSYD